MHHRDFCNARFRLLPLRSLPRVPRNPSRSAARVFALTVGMAMTCLANAFGDVKVDRLFPPAITVGASTVVTSEGKFDAWPAQVWCDRDDVTVTAEKDSGKWNITIAADAVPGIAWLRFYDDTSASSLMPLLVESVPIVAEVEPNNDPEKATRIDLPTACFGKLEKGGEVDCFIFSATAGQTVVASVMANRLLSSPMDAVLQLVDRRGNVLAQNDDARGIDPQIVFPVPKDGEYVLRLFAFPLVPNSTIGFAGGADFVYRIAVTAGPMLDYSLPLVEAATGHGEDDVPSLVGWNLPENVALKKVPSTDVSPTLVLAAGAVGWSSRPVVSQLVNPEIIDLTRLATSSQTDEATALQRLPALVSGQVERAGQVLKLRAAVPPGKKHRATIYSQSSNLKLDSVITVIDLESGKQLARNDDASSTVRDASIDFTASTKAEQATVEIQVSDLVGGFGSGRGFTMAIYQVEPSISIAVDAGEFKVAAGESLEIAVKIARADGFDQPVSIQAVDLPSGVTATEVVSEPKGDSSKEVKLKFEAAKVDTVSMRHASIRIVAVSTMPTDADKTELATASYQSKPGFKSSKLWITLTDAKPAK
ncbi:MAG TPA: serine protease [Planctomycetaceae bacterium]|nr:serine protease [Planctomycetaceae bacterium]